MSAQPVKTRRRWGRIFLVSAVVCLVFFLFGVWYTTTAQFHNWLRNHVVAALQDATGGRVELAQFHMIPFRLRFEGRDLTIHGTEVGAMPLGHADTVVAELRLT